MIDSLMKEIGIEGGSLGRMTEVSARRQGHREPDVRSAREEDKIEPPRNDDSRDDDR